MKRFVMPAGLTVLLVLVATLGTAPAAVDLSSSAPIAQAVQEQVQRHGWSRVIVEVRTPSGAHVPEGTLSSAAAVANQRAEIQSGQGRVLARMAGSDHRVVHRFSTVPFLALEVGPSGLTALQASLFDVVRVVEDKISYPLLSESGPLLQADRAWARGFDGTGTVIAVIDTGIQPTHYFLRNKVVDEACFSSGTFVLCPHGFEQEQGPGTGVMCPLNQCEHATHVAGIAAGSATSGGVWFSGVARGAQLASYAVFSGFNCGELVPPCIGALDSDILAALERIYAQRSTINFAAVNMSLGAGLFTSNCDDDVLKAAVDNLRSVGIPTVVAAGNSGTRDALSRPACISSTISVGATSKSNTVESFTSAAPFMTFFAPGSAIVSSVPLGLFQAASGTSMAAPHVAGIMAVLRQAMPAASVTDLVTALQATGVPVTDTRPDGTVTKPSPRLDAALDRLLGTGSGPSSTTLTPANAAAGGAAFTVTIDGAGFGAGATVLWNGAPRPTTFINAAQVTAGIGAADIIAAALVTVTVRNPDGRVTNTLTFTITSPTACPNRQYYVEYFSNATLTPPATRTECLIPSPNLWPPPINNFYGTGGPAGLPVDNFSVRWTGRFPFAAGDYTFRLLSWDEAVRLSVDGVVIADAGTPGGLARFTRTMTAGEHEVKLEYVELTGNALINVDWRAMGSGEPIVSGLSPEQVWSGGPGFALTVTGQFFDPGTTVFWQGEARPTTFVDASHLTAAIPADDIEFGEFAWVSVRTGDVQNSNARLVNVQQSPVITLITPQSVPAGNPAFTLFVEGAGLGGSVVHWNGTPRATTFFRENGGLGASISAADVATAGTATITAVFVDGRTSNAASFRITTPAESCPTGRFFAQYFSNVTLTPPATQTACEETINNVYGAGGPTGLPVDNFSVRWTGTFSFAGGPATFTARADDGVRVFLDGVAIIDQWHDQPATTYTTTVNVTGGLHQVKVEYYERGGDAVVQVSWTGGTLPAPRLGLLTPSSATAGGPAFVLSGEGDNFVAGATLLWNGAPRSTTVQSPTRLTASIPASDIAVAGSAQVSMRNPDSQVSIAQTYSITAPGSACRLGEFRAEYFNNVTLTPPAVRTQCEDAAAINNDYGAGGPPGLPVDNFSVRWTGTFSFRGGDETFAARADDGIRVFLDGVAVIDQWKDQPATTYTVRRAVTASQHEVKVEYYERGGDAVAQVSWTSIGGPSAPTLIALSPSSAAAGGPAFTLVVDGGDFRDGATVLWNGAPRPTTFLSAGGVSASISSADIATAGAIPVTLRNPDNSVTNALTFTVTGGSAPPTLATLTPASTTAGGAGFTLTADGGNFVSGATVLWNGAARTTSFVSATRVTAAIPAADVAAAGSATITVRNPDGRASNALTFAITAAGGCPSGQFLAEYFSNIALTPPATRTACEMAINYDYGAGGPAGLPVDNFSARWTGRFTFAAGTFTFTARADDGVRVFLDGVAIIDQWHDQPATTYTATRAVTGGEHEVKVEYYERGGDAVAQVSWAAGGTAPGPTLTALSPSSASAGAAAFTLTADGTNFTAGATVQWNGAVRTTTLVSATRVTASIPASDVAAAGSASVTVRNADGQTSNALTFTISPSAGGTVKVFITEPASGAIVKGTVWFTVWLEGAAVGNRTVTLSVGGRNITSTQTTTNGPISLPWPTTATDNGSRTATVSVGDSVGNTGSASITLTVAN